MREQSPLLYTNRGPAAHRSNGNNNDPTYQCSEGRERSSVTDRSKNKQSVNLLYATVYALVNVIISVPGEYKMKGLNRRHHALSNLY